MRIMPPANLPPRSSRAAAAHGRRGQRRRRRICACCFKVITKPDSRAQPESSFLPCRIPTRLVAADERRVYSEYAERRQKQNQMRSKL